MAIEVLFLVAWSNQDLSTVLAAVSNKNVYNYKTREEDTSTVNSLLHQQRNRVIIIMCQQAERVGVSHVKSPPGCVLI